MPKLPKRKPKDKDGETRESSRPFSDMAAIALSTGLSWRDLRRMKYTHLMQLLWSWEDVHSGESDDEPEPTNDAAGLLGL